MVYSFDDPAAATRKEVQYFETLGNRGIWHDGWKALTDHTLGEDFEDDAWCLFHLDEDYAENFDLAEERPDKLEEMIALWWQEAEKYNVLPLDDRGLFRLADGKPALVNQLNTFTYYPCVRRIPEHNAIKTRNRDHTITAYVDIPEGGAQGALFVNGTCFGGYSFYVQDGKLVYLYNYYGRESYIVRSTVDVPAGKSTLQYRYVNTGDHSGTGTLLINGKEVGSGPIDRTAKADYHLNQGASCGADPAPSVTDAYTPPFEFTGTLHKVVIAANGPSAPKSEGDWKNAMLEQ
jgi:arylsulfatase